MKKLCVCVSDLARLFLILDLETGESLKLKIIVRSEYKEPLLYCLMTLKTYQISRRCSVDLDLVFSYKVRLRFKCSPLLSPPVLKCGNVESSKSFTRSLGYRTNKVSLTLLFERFVFSLCIFQDRDSKLEQCTLGANTI